MDGLYLPKNVNMPPHEDVLSLAKLAGQAFVNSAIQEPLSGLSQLVNHVAGHDIVSAPHLVNAPEPAPFGSKAWYTETLASGLGMVLPFLAVEGTSNALLAKTGTLAERTSAGSRLARTLTMSADEAANAGRLVNATRFAAPAAKMALDGAIYGFALTPASHPTKDFWQQRGMAATSSALTFGAMGLASRGVAAGLEHALQVPLAAPVLESSLTGIGLRLGSSAIGGSVGGVVSAESNSILSGNGLASSDQLAQSMASFVVTGAVLDGAHIAGEGIKTTHAQSHARAEMLAKEKAIPNLSASDNQVLDQIQKAHFQYFRDNSDPVTGLTKDRSTATSPASIAAVGFALTAYPVAADRGWVNRDEAADYTLKVLKNLSATPQGDAKEGVSGRNGSFYHFLDPKTGLRAENSEVSTIDTALLMGGVLYSKNYFDGNNAKETQIRNLADNLYKRVDWNWFSMPDGRVSMGWTPENGFIPAKWEGLNEGPILLMLGMGSPTHPLPKTAWADYMSTAKVSAPYGHKSIEFGPLFGHQYPHIWIDFRGLQDATTKKLGFDYFENSRRAVLAQHDYAIDNPQKWNGYGPLDWGLTASDGPGEVTKTLDGNERQFHGYSARGFPNSLDDGTIAPTAAASSIAFTPEISLPTMKHWLSDRPELFNSNGFADAFNATFDTSKPSGWVDTDRLGIDQGPIMLMTENYRSGSIWNTMRKDPYLNQGLARAGFTGGQIDPHPTLSKLWNMLKPKS